MNKELMFVTGQPATRTRTRILLLFAVLLFAATAALVHASVTLERFEATPGPGQILVEWETATEPNNSGFYVLRAEQEAGEYSRISPFIAARGDSFTGAEYTYPDHAVRAGVTYFYRLQAVTNSGGIDTYGPVSATLEVQATILVPLIRR